MGYPAKIAFSTNDFSSTCGFYLKYGAHGSNGDWLIYGAREWKPQRAGSCLRALESLKIGCSDLYKTTTHALSKRKCVRFTFFSFFNTTYQ